MFTVFAHEAFTGEQEREMLEHMQNMMGGGMGGGWLWGLHSLLAFITWLALIAFLISAARYFWRKK